MIVSGSGDPVTVFAHGLAGDIAGTRPLGSAVAGRRVFFSFRGHGGACSPPGPWTFGDLAEDLRAVADATDATRAVGVSMGAGALCRLLADAPDRFERVVLYLPAPVNGVRTQRLRPFLEGRFDEAVTAEIPPELRDTPSGRSYLRQRVEQLKRDGLAPELDTLWREPAVPDLAALSAVTARVLVIGCVGDEVHPASVAEQLAGAFPAATLHVYDRPSVLWTNRKDLRERISGFLNP